MTIPTPTLHFPPMPPVVLRSVAVIGAGACGLVAARQLRLEGHRVVVFERDDRIGGTWIYNPQTESDPIGLDPSRTLIHSSLYASLRTNLAREIMGFREYPFVATGNPDRDNRRFPGHREVLEYLDDYAMEFGLTELTRFGTEVRYVGLSDGGKWKVRSGSGDGDQVDEIYDAVVVCNGHYTEPRIAEIPGIESWPGKQIHSHNYRVPEPFRDQVVILIGSANSAADISRDIAGFAKEVHIATRSDVDGTLWKMPGHDNVWHHSMIESAHEDGTVVFRDGSAACANTILHCTGYKYHFPFLDTNGFVTVDDNRVGPLYKHVFPPVLAPGLSFVGLPWKVVPFPLAEYQCKWIAGVLSGRLVLPSPEEMMEDVEAFYSELEASGVPKHYTHNMSGYQFDYDDWLAAECGCPGVEEWRKEMYAANSKSRKGKPNTYRDEWDDHHWILVAQEDFLKYSPKGNTHQGISQ